MAQHLKKKGTAGATPVLSSPSRGLAEQLSFVGGALKPAPSLFSGGMTSRKVFTLLAVLVTLVGAGVFLSLLRMTPNARHQAADRFRNALHLSAGENGRSLAVERILLEDGVPTNSVFKVSTRSRHYQVEPTLTCFTKGCRARNNILAYRGCADDVASQYNTLGVRSVERFVTSERHEPEDYNSGLLSDAIHYFDKALALDPNCAQVLTNKGLVLMYQGNLDQSLSVLKEALKFVEERSDKALVHVFGGLATEMRFNDRAKAAHDHYNNARELDPDVEQQWWGVVMTESSRRELHHLGGTEMVGPLIDCVLYKYFSPISISSYALLVPGTQDFFIQQSYTVVRKIVPPFVLAAMQRCYSALIEHKHLTFGDTQSKRFVSYNDRCGRFLQFHLTDFVRTVIAHNAKPTYTYFGGYRGGAELKTHNDREQCEFTISLTIEQRPHDLSWGLAMKDFDNKEQVADLNTGDGLIFMGRILEHYRIGSLVENGDLRQIFLHYVNEKFAGSLN